MDKRFKLFIRGAGILILALALTLTPAAYADHDPDGGLDDGMSVDTSDVGSYDPSAELSALDTALAGVVSSGPSANVIKNLALSGRGVRLAPGGTTDVYALNGYAYIGTFNTPCGDGTGANGSGVRIFDVHNKNKVTPAGFITSVAGSRINDIKVASMNSGTILVHSNESCAGGPGGYEVYDVANPLNPVHLAHVQVDDSNATLRDVFGVVDVGVHNLFLFTQGTRDYVALQAEGEFGSFQIHELTDPSAPTFVSAWGAEELCTLPFCSTDPQNETDPDVILDTIFGWMRTGFGASQNKYLHDMNITPDGTQAYLASWDAGLVLLDISDPTSPTLVSVALDVANGSPGDGEVNSHSVWPSEDGTIIVEGEEDFSAWEATVPPSNLTLDSPFPGNPTIPGTAISTTAGDDFAANQTGNTGTVTGSSVSVTGGPLAGNTYPAVELATAAGSPTFGTTGPLSGELVWIGQACSTTLGDPILNAGSIGPGDIAVARRGGCFFEEKAAAAASVGASALVLANNNPTSTPWSGLRIWDYSDPTSPVLASTFDTVCSASTAPGGTCDPRGTYSSHNVIVETTDNKVKAYISWYSDGVLIIDVSDPYNPVEVGRYHQAGSSFETSNGGIQNVWGVHKIVGEPWIYASDRNGGLYVLKEYGSGSSK